MAEDAASDDALYKRVARVGAAGVGATAGLMLAGPFGGVVAAAATQAALEGVGKLFEAATFQRVHRAALTMDYAVAQTGKSYEEVTEILASDDQLLELTRTVITAAAPSLLDAKLRALGQVLANVINDDATIDVEQAVAAALVGIEAPHLRVLDQLDRAQGTRIGQPVAVRHEQIGEKGFGITVDAFTALLDARGLVSRGPNTYDPGWQLTELGRFVLSRLRDAADKPMRHL